jgi:signal peptidase I
MPGDVVIDKPVSTGYRPGDVVTVQISAAGDLVTHRLTHVDKAGKIHTKGDANKTADAWALRSEHVRGVVRSHVPNLGYVIVFLQQPTGLLGVMTGALTLILLWGICFPKERETAAEEPVPAVPPLAAAA